MMPFVCSACGERHDDVPMAYRLDFDDGGYDPDAVRVERDGELIAAGNDLALYHIATKQAAS